MCSSDLIRERCENEDETSAAPNAPGCEEREREARGIYLAAGSAGHLTVPAADVDDWLDCDQIGRASCRERV